MVLFLLQASPQWLVGHPWDPPADPLTHCVLEEESRALLGECRSPQQDLSPSGLQCSWWVFEKDQDFLRVVTICDAFFYPCSSLVLVCCLGWRQQGSECLIGKLRHFASLGSAHPSLSPLGLTTTVGGHPDVSCGWAPLSWGPAARVLPPCSAPSQHRVDGMGAQPQCQGSQSCGAFSPYQPALGLRTWGCCSGSQGTVKCPPG